jgi:hypothetical protein
MSRIFPSWNQMNSLRVPLTEGERALAEFLDNHLPDAWSIYVQPYLNDMRPDVVVRNPRIGMVVFEVKDWTLGRYRFEHGRMIAQTNTRRWVEADPVQKAWIYARGLYEQFLISDEAVLDFGKKPNDLVLCCAAVYFHKASTEQALANRSISERFCPGNEIGRRRGFASAGLCGETASERASPEPNGMA